MSNYELLSDEVILYEGEAKSNILKGNVLLTLTSRRIIEEKEKGIIKKERELIEIISLEDVKFYNDEAQVKQKGADVEIQTVAKNIRFSFSGMLEAKKFSGKMINVLTGTTAVRRGADKIKGALDVVDDTLGVDTRGTIKGLLENGVKGTIINGIGKKK